VVDASGAARLASPAVTLAAYRPALILITVVAAIGTLTALSGLRRQRDIPAAPAREPLPSRAGLAGPGPVPAAELAACAAAAEVVPAAQAGRDSPG
jgi:hypothetical protein